ncbi:response regulator transcription factor [Anaerosacchariphilus polymeriproducens]|uniref:Stage 0 sporulation protein A homolog n=1 Tax=Anaerosacchariphilus polymeriproducens TaxID=1812858 RepID=A0A371ASX4_9FIRM|nr:response regulator transcription factor [Anaerosacchariphilus polymeriproducens]RDU22649.1 DNA-binding response regulator [Anaerosacchariphilus polymeriproducens]
MNTVLIADDNPQLLNILKTAAEKEGYGIILAEDGQAALEAFHNHRPQIILLDVMMPKLDGFQVCREIRKESNVPIIMITARGEDFEKIMGLEIGADDYIVKPFSPGEVMARIKAVMRRIQKSENVSEQVLLIEDLRINLADYSVYIASKPIPLTKREIDMLWTLVNGRNRAYTRDMLLDLLWGYDYYGDPRTVDSHMKRLRAKLDVIEHPTWEIRTVRNVGYKFEVTT